jgi:uncharacterized membrane protein YhaH (DUF805 family)
MTFGESISNCYSNYATFSGRASRSEFWFFNLFHFIIVCVACALIPVGIALLVFSALANLLPSLSVTVRRLHDTDHSGWWYWILLVPILGPILLLVWFCTKGSEGANDFGGNPLGDSQLLYPRASPPPNPPRDIAEELSKLAKLRDDGTISDEEFQRLKTKLI